MIQKNYSIYSNDLANQQLFVEVGKNHLACWCSKQGENRFTAFEFFQCDNYDASTFEGLINQAKLFSKLLTIDVEKLVILWITDANLAVPSEFASNEEFIKDNFCLLYGNSADAKLISRDCGDFLLVTSVEKYLYNAAHSIFFKAGFEPASCVNRKAEGDLAELFFYPNYFSLTVYKNGAMHFLQTKYYSQPEDVLYFILDVLHQYNIEKNIEIIAGGFIAVQSTLYELLYQYLEGLKLGSVNEEWFASTDFSEYPSHYFLPYINYFA